MKKKFKVQMTGGHFISLQNARLFVIGVNKA